MKNRNLSGAAAAVIGFALLAAGLLTVKLFAPVGQPLPYLCIGLGCGAFGHGMGELVIRRTEKGRPELARRREIEENDERNITLRDRAQARAYRMMVPVLGALLMSFGLMGVDLTVVLLLAATYLYICGCSVYYSERYRREM